MTRKTIAILRKLVRRELKEHRAAYRGWVYQGEKKWYEDRIKEFEACLEEIKEIAGP